MFQRFPETKCLGPRFRTKAKCVHKIKRCVFAAWAWASVTCRTKPKNHSLENVFVWTVGPHRNCASTLYKNFSTQTLVLLMSFLQPLLRSSLGDLGRQHGEQSLTNNHGCMVAIPVHARMQGKVQGRITHKITYTQNTNTKHTQLCPCRWKCSSYHSRNKRVKHVANPMCQPSAAKR